jgi:hypothetical protein
VRRAAVLALALLVGGCSLPLPRGVRTDADVQGQGRAAADIQVLPPGPQRGAGPTEVVQGFLGAESSPEGQHAIARSYLDQDSHDRWQDSEVQVYDPATLRVEQTSTSPTSVSVRSTFTVLGSLAVDGRYTSTRKPGVSDNYQVVRDSGGQWRIADPPFGLRLTPADRDRSFRARRVYYVSPTGERFRHVVPDLVMLPVGDGPEDVVRHLLAGPSSGLAGSVRSGFPAGTKLRSLHSARGVVGVDLSSAVVAASSLDRQLLSAQLVWTLRALDPAFARLELTADGSPLAVSGEGTVQRVDDWAVYDPEGLAPGPLLYLAAGRVRATGGDPTVVPDALSDVSAHDLAVTPDRTQVAVLQRAGGGQVVVRMGPSSGPLREVLRGSDLSSPSWGSGELGLWTTDGSDQLLLVRPRGGAVRVPVDGVAGPLTGVAASRDGVRVAVVSHGLLYVGRVERTGAGLRVQHAVAVSPQLSGVTAVVWRDGTSLVALGVLSGTFVPALLSVDGASVRALSPSALPSQPSQVAAEPDSIVVTAAGSLYLLGALGFRKGPAGTAPTYPG